MTCYYCERELVLPTIEDTNPPMVRTVDHIIPLSKGGNNSKYNKVDACQECNNLKDCRTLNSFRNFLILRIEELEGGVVNKKNKLSIELLRTVLINTSKLIRKTSDYKHKLLKGYIDKPNRSKKYVSLEPEPQIKIIPLDNAEHQHFLMHQTHEQFELAKKHGWRFAKMITEQIQNFHYE